LAIFFIGLNFQLFDINIFIFIKKNIIIVIYINNFFIIRDFINNIKTLKIIFNNRFKILDFGIYYFYLNIEIIKNRL